MGHLLATKRAQAKAPQNRSARQIMWEACFPLASRVRAYLPAHGARAPMTVGSKQDVFSLPEGEVVLEWPEQMSPESYEDFESWVNLVLRKVRRSVREPAKAPSHP